MRILNICLTSDLGGIVQVFKDYYIGLKKSGCEVLNIVHPKLNKKFFGDDFRYVKNYGNYDFFAKRKISKIINEFKPDVIITHGNRATNLTYYGAKKADCKVITVAHNFWIKPKIFKKLDYIFAITNKVAQFYIDKNFDENKIFITYNMVEIDEPIKKIKNDNLITLGAFARLVPQKGLDILINAMAEVAKRRDNIKLIIGGEGPLRNELVQLRDKLNLKDKIDFLGWVTNKRSFYEKLDICVIPSRLEPFGLVVIEAMMYGIPVIASEIDGPKEIITNMKDGILFQSENSQMLANAIITLADNKILQEDIIINGKELVDEKYSQEKVVERIINAIELIISR